MEQQETSPNLSSRESVQRKIANALDYLGENYNIIDKSVRDGDATTMDIARSFTGDIKSDKLIENLGLLDVTPFGTYFAAEEGQDAINKAEPDAVKRSMALLNYMRQPLQTIIDRPEIGLPATDIALGGIEAIPFGYVVTKPIKTFLKSLKSKVPTTKNNSGMITQQTSLPTSGDVSTTTAPVKNEEIDQSRRKFVKNAGTVGALGLLGTQVPDAIKLVNNIKVAKKIKPIVTFESAKTAFIKPRLINYLKDSVNPDDSQPLVEEVESILFERLPLYKKALNDGEGDKFFETKYGLDRDALETLTVDDIKANKSLMKDLSIDVGGDDSFDFKQKVQEMALKDGGKINNNAKLTNPEFDLNESEDVVNEMDNAVSDYYQSLKSQGMSPDDIVEMVLDN